MDSEDVLVIYDVKGVDGVGRNVAEEAYAVEEVANDVFLGEPAVLSIVMAG